ncbi:DsbA family protein [Celerinatantimonas sp. YJH-8]|uniref:DsbA family protein n=1 Tax=Celerinatantimonas sp. YJH-8 TaxID=3228714 RepID=UPI0038C5EF77
MNRLKLSVAVSAMVVSSTLVAADAAVTNFTPEQQQQIGKIAADYLLEHPEVLLQASQKLQQMQQQQQQAQLTSQAVSMHHQLMALEQIPHVGPADAKVTVTEFFDYQCYYCSQMAPEIEKLVKANPKVKFIFRDWPIFASRWESSATAAFTGLEVWKQKGADAYLSYHNGIYQTGHNEGKLTKADIESVADKALGSSLGSVPSKAYRSVIAHNYMLAQSIGFKGTPAFIVMPAKGASVENTSVVAGAAPAAVLQQAIDKAAQ